MTILKTLLKNILLPKANLLLFSLAIHKEVRVQKGIDHGSFKKMDSCLMLQGKMREVILVV